MNQNEKTNPQTEPGAGPPAAIGEPQYIVGQSLVQALADYIGKSSGPVREAMVLVQMLQSLQPIAAPTGDDGGNGAGS